MHNTALRQVIRIRVMLGYPVIPDCHIILPPAPAHLEIGFSDMGKEEVQQRIALFLLQPDNARGKALIDE